MASNNGNSMGSVPPVPPGPNGHIPDLTSAVDLGSPVQVTLRQFAANMARAQAYGVICIGVLPSGQIVMAGHIPGGRHQAIGMLEETKMLVMGSEFAPERAPVDPPEGEDKQEDKQ